MCICINKYMMWMMNDFRIEVYIISWLLLKYIKEYVDIRFVLYWGCFGSVLMKVSLFYCYMVFFRRV